MAFTPDATTANGTTSDMDYFSDDENEQQQKKGFDATLLNLDNNKKKTTVFKKSMKKDTDNLAMKLEMKRLKKELADMSAKLAAAMDTINTYNTRNNLAKVNTYNRFQALADLDAAPSTSSTTKPTNTAQTSGGSSSHTSLFQTTSAKRPATSNSTATGTVPKKPKQSIGPDGVQRKAPKPPPLVVSNLDCKKMAKQLAETIGPDAFSFRRLNENTTHVKTTNLSDFKSVKGMLESAEMSHHTFTPKEEQNTNLVLRHLDESYEVDDIVEAINALGLDIALTKVMRLPTKFKSLWLIQLGPGSDVKQLLSQRYILHQNVVFERKKQNGITQCTNCQLFGHSSRNCGRKFRCVKCKDDHAPGQCQRTLNPQLAEETPPSCVNCNSNEHPANFRGCPYYTKLVQQKQQQHQPKNTSTTPAGKHNKPNPSVHPVSSPAGVKTGISYAAATASQELRSPNNVQSFFEKEYNELFNIGFTDLLATMKKFYPKYVNLPKDKRPLALLDLTLSLIK